jgi:hypothetical protein
MGHGKFGGKGMMFAKPLLSRWLDTSSTFSVLNPVSNHWLILVLVSDYRQEAWRTFG